MYYRDLEKEALDIEKIKDFIKKFWGGLSSQNPASLFRAGGPTSSGAKVKLQLLKAFDSIRGNVDRFTQNMDFAKKNPGLYNSFKNQSIIKDDTIRSLKKQLQYADKESLKAFRDLLKYREELGKVKYGPYFKDILDLPNSVPRV